MLTSPHKFKRHLVIAIISAYFLAADEMVISEI